MMSATTCIKLSVHIYIINSRIMLVTRGKEQYPKTFGQVLILKLPRAVWVLCSALLAHFILSVPIAAWLFCLVLFRLSDRHHAFSRT